MSDSIPAPWADWWELHRNLNESINCDAFSGLSNNLTVSIHGIVALTSLAQYVRVAQYINTSLDDADFSLERTIFSSEHTAVTWKIAIPETPEGLPSETTYGVVVLSAKDGQITEAKFYFNSPRVRWLLSSIDTTGDTSSVTPLRSKKIASA